MKRHVLRPASAVEMERRVRQMVRALPMSKQELHDQVVILDADEPLFEPALRKARAEGVVIRDKHPGWLRLAAS